MGKTKEPKSIAALAAQICECEIEGMKVPEWLKAQAKIANKLGEGEHSSLMTQEEIEEEERIQKLRWRGPGAGLVLEQLAKEVDPTILSPKQKESLAVGLELIQAQIRRKKGHAEVEREIGLDEGDLSQLHSELVEERNSRGIRDTEAQKLERGLARRAGTNEDQKRDAALAATLLTSLLNEMGISTERERG